VGGVDLGLGVAPFRLLCRFGRELSWRLTSEGVSLKIADELHRLDAHGDDLTDESQDVFLVVGAVGVADDLFRVGLVAFDAILVNHPFQRRAVAEPVIEHLGCPQHSAANRMAQEQAFLRERTEATCRDTPWTSGQN